MSNPVKISLGSFQAPQFSVKPAPKPKAQSSKITLGEDSDDEDTSASTRKSAVPAGNKALVAFSIKNSSLSSAQQPAKLLDESVYDYDGVFDKMAEAREAAALARKQESSSKEAKYMPALIAAAKLRKLEHAAAEQKLFAHERELEGDEFEGGEKFVTEGYRERMEQLRKEEAEEEQRALAEEEAKRNKGSSQFVYDMIKANEDVHEAAMAAAQLKPLAKGIIVQPPSAPEPSQPSSRVKDNLQAVKDALERGEEDVELDDDGNFVDTRQSLKAGLNIISKPAAGFSLGQNSKSNQTKYVRQAVGSASLLQDVRARQRSQIERQKAEIAEAQERDARKKEEEYEEERKRKRNDDSSVSDAKRRYLERKAAAQLESK